MKQNLIAIQIRWQERTYFMLGIAFFKETALFDDNATYFVSGHDHLYYRIQIYDFTPIQEYVAFTIEFLISTEMSISI